MHKLGLDLKSASHWKILLCLALAPSTFERQGHLKTKIVWISKAAIAKCAMKKYCC